MKRGIIFAVIFFAITANAASDVVSWARVYTPNDEAYESLVYRHDLDVASARRPAYVDLVAPQSKLDELGYPYEYLQYDCLAPESFAGRGYSGYHNYDELVADLETLAADYPNICTLTDMGQGHVELGQIWLLKISDDVGTDDPDESDLLITGVHHAREPMTLEVPLAFAQYLCENYAGRQDVQYIVDNLEFYIMPCMNIDGYIYDDVENERNWWRKNGYDWPGDEPTDWGWGEGTGVDNNRNYTYMWGYDNQGSSPDWWSQIYRGPSAGSEPENQIVMDLADEKDFKAAISYHSYSEVIIKPWCYDYLYTDDDDTYNEMVEVINEKIHEHLGYYYDYGTGWEVMYLVNGGFDDYFYGEHGTLGITIELNSESQGGFYPSDALIEPTCDTMTDAMMAWAEWCISEFTDINLTRFDARWADGEAELSWNISDGAAAAGFNLYREPDDGTGKTLVNAERITGDAPYRYIDASASPALSYEYYLEAIDETGAATSYGPVHLGAIGGTKTAFALYQTSPNPTAGPVTFKFSVADDSAGELAVYDIAGRKVLTVAEGPFAAGEHSVAADLASAPPGVYVYRLTAGAETAVKKLVVTK